MNLNKLRDEIHENAVKHGFWEGERSIAECLALIHSGVSEALEADRKGQYANGNIKPETIDWMTKTWEKSTFMENFILKVKDTFEDELADVVIRCLDLCGHLSFSVNDRFSDLILEYTDNEMKGLTIPERLFVIHSVISKRGEWDENLYIIEIVATVFQIARVSNIDIEKHIELKMKYNSTRPYKHGKKY